MTLFDFDYQFVKYGSFHDNKINQLVHVIFVPTLLVTAMVWISYTPEIATWAYSDTLPLNAAFVVAALYSVYYIALWPLLGLLATPYVFGLYYIAQHFAAAKPFGFDPVPVSIAIHIVSWIFQIGAHGIFEGNSPALTEDPLQPHVLAPLFVFCEVLFAIGLFPKTQERLAKKVKAHIVVLKKAGVLKDTKKAQ